MEKIKSRALTVCLCTILTIISLFQVAVFAVDEDGNPQQGNEAAEDNNNAVSTPEGSGAVNDKTDEEKNDSKSAEAGKKEDDKTQKPDPVRGTARMAMLFCQNTGEDLFEYKVNTKVLPYETVHLMTAMLALQRLPLDKYVTISEQAAAQSGAKLGLKAGESVSVETLLNGAILLGANDCAYALAEASSKSVEEFVSLMNETAKKLKCKETLFNSPAGNTTSLENCHVTAKDLMIIARTAYSDKTLAEILESKKYTVKDVSKENKRIIERKDGIIKDSVTGISGGISGTSSDGKTSSCVVFYNKNGLKQIAVMMGQSKDSMSKDWTGFFDYGASAVKGVAVIKAGEEAGKVRVKHGAKTKIPVYAVKDGMAYLPKEGSKSLVETEVKVKSDVTAPVKKGQVVGTYEIYIAGEKVNEIDLITDEDVEPGWILSYIGISNRATEIILAVLGVFLFLLIVRKFNKIKSRRKRRKLRQERIMKLALEELQNEYDRQRRDYRRYKSK